MTLLLSFYTAEGITFAADTQTVWFDRGGRSSRAGPQRKVFRVRRVGVARQGAVLGFFGLAQVNRRPMSDWLNDLIGRWDGSKKSEDFASFLCRELNDASFREEEKHEACGFHLGAFDEIECIAVPMFHFVTNARQFDPTTGRHFDVGTFEQEEQLASHYAREPIGCDPLELRKGLREFQRATSFPFWLRNGDLDYAKLTWEGLQRAVRGIASLPAFSLPSRLEDWDELAKTLIRTSRDLYRPFYRHGAPLIGGRVDARSIPWP